ncbi:MAG: histidine kinase [Deltaproteobacteria bacterium]|nr:histidine kinase [Kofleriaceae bacterium]
MRAIGIPGFGLAIPRVTGLLDGVAPSSPVYWLGSVLFVVLAGAIWHGNRWLLLEQRRHWGWFDHPVRKLVMLLAAIVLFTAPLTASTLAGWYVWLGRPADVGVIRTVVLMNVICVVFVTHVYETVFLIKERESDQLRVAELDRARAEAELAAFRAQVDPHFLFNALHTLGALIESDPARAGRFNAHLAELHRYLLRHAGQPLVALADELGFVADYVELVSLRFGSGIVVETIGAAGASARVPPMAVQVLVENAIKHNQVLAHDPLRVTITVSDAEVSVSNPVRPRRTQRPSAGIGLANLAERSRLATGRPITVAQRDGRFTVTVPVAAGAAGAA